MEETFCCSYPPSYIVLKRFYESSGINRKITIITVCFCLVTSMIDWKVLTTIQYVCCAFYTMLRGVSTG